jgi:hypothetical protein
MATRGGGAVIASRLWCAVLSELIDRAVSRRPQPDRGTIHVYGIFAIVSNVFLVLMIRYVLRGRFGVFFLLSSPFPFPFLLRIHSVFFKKKYERVILPMLFFFSTHIYI